MKNDQSIDLGLTGYEERFYEHGGTARCEKAKGRGNPAG